MAPASLSSPSDIHERRQAFYRTVWLKRSKHHKGFDSLAVETTFNLAQTFNLAEAYLASRMQKKGLTLAGFNVLIIVKEYPDGCALNMLSDLLVVSRANITGLVDSLVRKGLMKRQEDAVDRRVVRARITKKGEAFLNSYLVQHYKAIFATSAGLSTEEKRTFIKLLTKMRQNLLRLRQKEAQ